MTVITILLLLAIVFVLCWTYFHKKYENLPPGPWNLPILGSLHRIDGQAPHISLTELSIKYGSIYGLKLGAFYTVVVSDAKLLQKILTKPESDGRPPLYIVKVMFGEKGIANSQIWKKQRKLIIKFLNNMITSSKTPSERMSLEDKIMENIQIFMKNLKPKEDETMMDPANLVEHCITNMSSVLLFGKSWSWETEIWKRLVDALQLIARSAAFAAPLNFLPLLRILPKYKKMIHTLIQTRDTLHKIQDEIINDCKKSFLDNNNTSYDIIKAFFEEKKIVGTHELIDLDELRHLVFDMFGASVETTTNSILWAIMYLAAYPQVQSKARKEVFNTFQNKTLRTGDIQNLPYVEATLAEINRIRTVAPTGFPHMALEDIHVSGFKIPKNAIIMPLLWAINMDSNIWNDPEEFRPERFLNDSGTFYKPHLFIPFNTGRRICPGESYAKMVIFLFIGTLLQNYEIQKCDGSPVDLRENCGLTLSPNRQKLIFRKI